MSRYPEGMEQQQIISAQDTVYAPASAVFELIADPARQPEWDGNENLEISQAQRVSGVGDVFTMSLTNGKVRDNYIVEFDEGRVIAWKPASEGQEPAGHLWKWEVEALDETICRVTHTYDYTQLTDESRMAKAQSMTQENLAASISRLKSLAEASN